MKLSSRHGFTLIELLLVIGIIAVLASIVIIAINPTKQLAQARDTQRRSDIQAILNAVYQYQIDTGSLPAGIPIGADNAIEICNSNHLDCTGLLDLNALTGSYIVRIPQDPQIDSENPGTNYSMYKTANGRITVEALAPEIATSISVTR